MALAFGPSTAIHALAHTALLEYIPFILLLLALVHGRRRHSRPRQHPRRAGHQHDPARDRHRARQLHRHHRRLHGDDPPGHARQRRPAAQRARDRLLHLPGLEYRRLAHAARRSAALPRLPARRRFLLDHHAPAAARRFSSSALLLALFFAVDLAIYQKEGRVRPDPTPDNPVRITGGINFVADRASSSPRS